MKQLIKDYAAYNLWANTKITSFISAISDEMMNTPVQSSFPSLRKTVEHIMGAERVWSLRLTGKSLDKITDGSIEIRKEELCRQWLNISSSLVKYIDTLDSTSLEKVIYYKNTRGDSVQNKVYEMLMHCFNHSTYHRGQTVTLLRELGFTSLSSTDLITYYRNKLSR